MEREGGGEFGGLPSPSKNGRWKERIEGGREGQQRNFFLEVSLKKVGEDGKRGEKKKEEKSCYDKPWLLGCLSPSPSLFPPPFEHCPRLYLRKKRGGGDLPEERSRRGGRKRGKYRQKYPKQSEEKAARSRVRADRLPHRHSPPPHSSQSRKRTGRDNNNFGERRKPKKRCR